MKKMNIWMVFVLAFALASAVFAVEVDPRPNLKYGGTHCVTVKYSDFTETTVNTAQTLTWTVSSGQAVELVAMELVTAFDSGDTNYTGSCAVKVGDGTDDDLYLTSTEMASDGTEVWYKFVNMNAGTIAVTPQTTVLTYATNVLNTTGLAYTNATLETVSLTDTNAVTADVVTNIVFETGTFLASSTIQTTTATVATNATAAFTASTLGRKVYTADDTVDFVFTPNTEEALTANTSGEVRFYFKWLE